MPEPLMRPQSAPLRFLAVRLDLPELVSVARQPGIVEAFRLTVQYHDARHPDQIATLVKHQQPGPARLTACYRRASDKPLWLDYEIDEIRFHGFGAALHKLNFDKLDDQPDIPWYGADLWLLERASGTFHHDVIIVPERARTANPSLPHAEIVILVREKLREAVRAINP